MFVVPQNQTSRPSSHEPYGTRGERLLAAMRDRKSVVKAIAPFDLDHPVASILSEADLMLRIAGVLLEDHLDANSLGSPAAPVAELLFTLRMRLQCAESFLHEEERDAAKQAAAQGAREAPPEVTQEGAATAAEMLRTIETELAAVSRRAKDGPDTLAEERRVAAICADLERIQRLARSAADIVTPSENELSHDAEE